MSALSQPIVRLTLCPRNFERKQKSCGEYWNPNNDTNVWVSCSAFPVCRFLRLLEDFSDWLFSCRFAQCSPSQYTQSVHWQMHSIGREDWLCNRCHLGNDIPSSEDDWLCFPSYTTVHIAHITFLSWSMFASFNSWQRTTWWELPILASPDQSPKWHEAWWARSLTWLRKSCSGLDGTALQWTFTGQPESTTMVLTVQRLLSPDPSPHWRSHRLSYRCFQSGYHPVEDDKNNTGFRLITFSLAIILCTTSTVISLWTCSLSWPSSCTPHRLLSPYGHAVCHGHHPVEDHVDCYLLAFSLAIILYTDCYLLMDMQFVLAIILCTTSTVISLWTCSLSWPSSCAPHRLLSPYGHAVCHGHHPVEDHIDCYLLAFSLAIIMYKTTSAVINCYFFTFSLACRRSSRLLSPYFQHGHHPLEDHIGSHLYKITSPSYPYFQSCHHPVEDCFGSHIFTFSLAIIA